MHINILILCCCLFLLEMKWDEHLSAVQWLRGDGEVGGGCGTLVKM